jgi:hypothetical protein
VPPYIVIDPTLILVQRGRVWIERATGTTSMPLMTSKTLLDALACRDESALGTYRPRGLFGYVDLPSPPSGLHGLAAPSPLDDAVSECLLRSGRHGHIVADLWYALQEDVWLIARRATTLDQLVQAGVRLIVEGHNGYLTAIDEIASSLGLELANALARRTRYLVSRTGWYREYDWVPPPTLVVYDSGVGQYR